MVGDPPFAFARNTGKAHQASSLFTTDINFRHGEEHATLSVHCRHCIYPDEQSSCVRSAQYREGDEHFNPRALDWRYPREVMTPPARLFFTVLQKNSAEKLLRYSQMNRTIFLNVVGRVPTRKSQGSFLQVHWCRVAVDCHGVASRCRRPHLQVRVLECFLHGGPAEPIDELCAMGP